MYNEPTVECTSEETNTSLSSWENKKNKLTSHVVDFNESKTHMFYLIQSANERNDKTKRLIRIKISKERPTSRKFLSKKMLVRCGNIDDMTDDNQEKTNKTSRPTHASIHSRTDHPSFVVLPHVISRRRGNIRKNIERNQSTSENSNETYVIRTKEDNKIEGSSWKVPTMSPWKRNSQTVAADFSHGLDVNLIAKPNSPDYCECGEGNAGKSTNVDMQNPNKNISEAKGAVWKKPYLRKDDLFNIKFVQSPQQDSSQRLRAGQDNNRRYKSCSMCPNMTRIFPPPSVGRRTAFQSNNSDSGSNSTLKNRKGYVKINFKLIRQCLITAPANEKCKVLDAIRLRMTSPDFNLAIKTIEDIVTFDLFGVQCECRSRPLLEDLLWPINVSSYELQTSIARFVNALVSYKIGRSYFSNKSVIHMLTWGDIGRYNIDPIMGDNLIGIMMKLSCSRFQRSDMIKNGLLRWLLQHMEAEEYSMSKYHLQCMTGLLRNLLRGYNLDDLSTIETRKLIVLMGRYLDTENVTAKRYICDSLMTLFRSIKHVTSAKELNFQRIIEGHLTRAVDPKQKEHFRAVYQLLNRSSTSKSFSIPKFDSPSEEDPYLDTDLESDISGEKDPYLGECLLREKFSVDTETHCNDKNFNESNAETHKDGRLISRVFVEHLNCFLPNIEKNRIFPLCNARCADKIKTCSHLGENQRKKRQHYIPPNSRVSGFKFQQPSNDDSDEAALDYKSMKHAPTSAEKVITHISTISHDKSAARWDHFHDIASNISSTGMERLDAFDSTLEEIVRSESYYPDPSELADILNDSNDSAIENKVEVPGEQLELKMESSEPSIENETLHGTSIKRETKKEQAKPGEGLRPKEDEQFSLHTTTVDTVGFTNNDDQLTDDRTSKNVSISTTPITNQADNANIEKMVEMMNLKSNKNEQKNLSTVDGRKTADGLAREDNKELTSDDKITKSKTDELLTVDSRKTTGGLSREHNEELISGDTIAKSKTEELSTVDGRKTIGGLSREGNKKLTSGDTIAKSKTEELLSVDGRKTTGGLSREGNKKLTSGDKITDKLSTVDSLKTTGSLSREHNKELISGDTITKSETEELSTADGRKTTNSLEREDNKQLTSGDTINKSKTEENMVGRQEINSPNQKSKHRASDTILSSQPTPKPTQATLKETKLSQKQVELASEPISKSKLNEYSSNQDLEVKDNGKLTRHFSENLQQPKILENVSGRKLPVRSEEALVSSQTGQNLPTMKNSQPARTPACTSKENQITEVLTSHQLQARSMETFKAPGQIRQSSRSATKLKTNVVGEDLERNKVVKRTSSSRNINIAHAIIRHSSDSSITSQPITKRSQIDIGNHSKLHARSAETLTNLKVAQRKSPATTIQQIEIIERKDFTEMHARSMEILTSATVAEKTTVEKSEKDRTPEKNNELSSTTTLKDDIHQLHARSLEVIKHPRKVFETSVRTVKKSKSTIALETDEKSRNTRSVERCNYTASTAISTNEASLIQSKSVEAFSPKKISEQLTTESMKSTKAADPQQSQRKIPDKLEIDLYDPSQHVGQSVVVRKKESLTTIPPTKSKQHEVGRKMQARSMEILSLTAAEKSSTVKTNQPPVFEEVRSSARITNLSSVSTAKENVSGEITQIHQLHARSTEVLKHPKNEAVRKSKSTIEISRNPSASADDSVPADGKSKEIAVVGGIKTNEGDRGVSSMAEDNVRTKRLPETSTSDQKPATTEKLTNVAIAGDLPFTSGKIIPNPKTDEKSRNIRSVESSNYRLSDVESEETLSSKSVKLTSEPTGKENTIDEMSLIQQSKSVEALSPNKDSEPFTTKLIKSASETDPQSQHKLPEKLDVRLDNPSQSDGVVAVVGESEDHSISNRPTKSKELNVVQDEVECEVVAKSEEMTSKISPSLEAKRTNYQLSKSNSDSLLESIKDYDSTLGQRDSKDSVDENKLIHQLPARSEELVVMKRKSMHSSVIHATQSTITIKGLKNPRHNTGFISGDSSKSSINKSQDCVDCEGNGYVLRARPSHPCDRCKVSLSKYPRFVDALTEGVSPSDDGQHRVVTRTTDDSIKVHWVSKTNENQISEPNQEKSNEDKFDESNVHEKSAETKNEAEQNTSIPKAMSSSTERCLSKTKEKLNFSKDSLDEVNMTSRSAKVTCSEPSLLPTETESTDLANSFKGFNTTVGSLSEKLREEQNSRSGKNTDDVNVTSTKHIKESIIFNQTGAGQNIIKSTVNITVQPSIFGQKSVIIDVDDDEGQHSNTKPSTTTESKKLLQNTSEHKQFSGGTESIVNVEDVEAQSADMSNVDEALTLMSDPPFLDGNKTKETNDETVKDKDFQPFIDTTKERDIHSAESGHLLLARSVETTSNLNDAQRINLSSNNNQLLFLNDLQTEVSQESTSPVLDSQNVNDTRHNQRSKHDKTSSSITDVSSVEKDEQNYVGTDKKSKEPDVKIGIQKIVSNDVGNFIALDGRLQLNDFQTKQDETALDEHCEEKGSIHTKALPQEQTKSLRKNAESVVDSGEKILKLVKGEELNNEAIIKNQLPTAASVVKSDTTVNMKCISAKTTDKVSLGLEGSTTAMRIGGVESSPEMSIETPLVVNDRVANNNLSKNNRKLNESPNLMNTSTDDQARSSNSHHQLSMPIVTEIQPTNEFNKIEDTCEDISGSKQPKTVQSTENLIKSDHTENVDLTAPAIVLENKADQEGSMNGSIARQINVSATPDDRQLLAVRSMANVNTIFISQSESLKKQAESERNNSELAATGCKDDQVLTPRSTYNIRIEYAGPQSFHSPLGRSLKMRQRNIFSGDDHLLTSRSAPQGYESSLRQSLKKINEADVGGTYNEVLDNRSELSNKIKESVASGGSSDLMYNEVFAQRPDNDIRSEITLPQGNKSTLCEILKTTEQTAPAGKTDDQYLDHRPDDIRIEIATSRDNQSSLSESSKNFKDKISVSQDYQGPSTKLKQTEIRESKGSDEQLTTTTLNVSQHKSMNKSISKQLNDQQENHSTLSDPLLCALDKISCEIPAPHINQTPFTNKTKTTTTEENGYHESSSQPQQNNQTPLSEPLKSLKQVGELKQGVLPATSLDKVGGEEAEKCNLLLARSMEMVPEKSPIKNLRQDQVKDVKSDNQTRQECHGSVMNEMKSICNKTSTVSDEEWNYLNLDGQTAAYHTETNRELSRALSEDRQVQGVHEVINSTCCRQLLNDEELINRLSEKVFKKLFTEIHCCGPNCKSPCGGRNSYFKASERQ